MQLKLKGMATAAKQQQVESSDVVRHLVMGRWRWSLSSGLRAALACTIVGLVSLYAPAALRRHITFPAFSYVVTVILVTDEATLGTALRGAASAVQGTLMGAAPSVAALWLAHRTGAAESVVATSAVVALTAFAVALPESSVGPVAKRIALGQAIIIYVARFHYFQQGEGRALNAALLHPANVVACTALGVAAALLAVLLPWPRLATREARDKSRAYKVVVAERVRVLADAFFINIGVGAAAETEADACIIQRRRRWQMAACMSEANRLASASTALVNRMNAIKEDLQWERAVVVDEDDNKQIGSMELPLAGMQIALATMQQQQQCNHNKEEIMEVDLAMAMRDQIRLALLTPNKQMMALLTTFGSSRSCYWSNHQQLAPFLFLFSLYQLHCAACACWRPEEAEAATATAAAEKATMRTTTTKVRPRLLAAAKCGFSLGLAVLLGLLLSNDHGFWSGLIVATTMTAGRQSTWAVAVARAHGTALGSVYGVLGCQLLIMSRHAFTVAMDLRFLALLPWMVVATFLKRSRAYGPAGGVAAALSAVIIMGRRYDEAPMAFTVARLVETFMGISCAVLGDLVFQPGARPSVQAREQLARCVAAMADLLVADADGGRRERQQQELALALLSKYVAEARSEPTYLWLPPFPAACYDKIQGSLGRMAQLLQLYHQARRQLYHHGQVDVDGDANTIRFSTSLSHCLHMLAPPPQGEEEAKKPEGQVVDLEAAAGVCSCCYNDDEVVGSFLAQARGLLLNDDDGGDNVQPQQEERFLAVCCLGSIALCMGEIIKEAQRLEAHILDLPHVLNAN